jgi:hypothetical protein
MRVNTFPVNVTSRSLDVTNKTDADHWWGLDDGHGLQDFLLVDLGTGPVSLANDVGHASLKAQEAGQVDGLRGVVLGESLHLASVTSCALLGVEPHGPVTGSRKLTMRLKTRYVKTLTL